ncbi:MAG TPA: hypothetical protein VNU94_05120 [Acidobacteriaceae bacterium]|nr:hypothetical protein [Acidobacteriaceae bacterium]
MSTGAALEKKYSAPWTDHTAGRWFYAAMAAAAVLITLGSFTPSIAYPKHRLGGYTWLTVTHGILFATWLVVFLVQTLLVRGRKISLHRTLGTASLFLAAAMIVFGYMAQIVMTRRGFDFSGDLGVKNYPIGPLGQMLFPLLDILEFGILVAAGYFYRRNIAAHKRLMLFATAAILPGSFAHIVGHYAVLRAHPNSIIPMVALSLAASAIYDLLRFHRIHPVSFWIGGGMFGIDTLCNNIIGPSAAWHRFAAWLIR